MIKSAGVLIIDGNSDIILIREISTGLYNNPGGWIEHNASIPYTAEKELKEETRGLINFSVIQHKYVDVGEHRCYILNISGIRCRDFYAIDTTKMPSCYRETDKMSRFPIESLKKDYKNKNGGVLSEWQSMKTNNIVTNSKVSTRALAAIRKAIKAGYL